VQTLPIETIATVEATAPDVLAQPAITFRMWHDLSSDGASPVIGGIPAQDGSSLLVAMEQAPSELAARAVLKRPEAGFPPAADGTVCGAEADRRRWTRSAFPPMA
jgi:hypothetical protein